jgi:hypothetical protein
VIGRGWDGRDEAGHMGYLGSESHTLTCPGPHFGLGISSTLISSFP